LTFDSKRQLKQLVFKPDARALALEREAWGIIIAETRKVQAALSIEIEDNGFETTIRRIIEDGTTLEHVAVLDGLLGEAGDAYQITAAEVQDIDGDGALIAAWEARAKTFLRAVLKEGPTAGHVHHANGHTRLA
jgi:hypothetical protein